MQESCNHLERELFGKELKKTNSISKEKALRNEGLFEYRTGLEPATSARGDRTYVN